MDITVDNKMSYGKFGKSAPQANWLGRTWAIEYNDSKYPSMNQISQGLIAEARLQIKLALGDVKE